MNLGFLNDENDSGSGALFQFFDLEFGDLDDFIIIIVVHFGLLVS